MALDIAHTRSLLLRCMCGIYLLAFLSLYLQIRGLYGSSGVLPAHPLLRGYSSVTDCIAHRLTLVCLAPTLGLSAHHAMELLALAGVALAAGGLVFITLCRSQLFLILVILYLSLHSLGQIFLYFQWDSLLLEVGWLCVLAAPLSRSPVAPRAPHIPITFWLLRWLLFRFMFASGVVKLKSDCPTWWGLTALTVHYESQCIPTPLAWYAHHLPVWFHKLCVVATFVIEIPMPLLFLSPLRGHRLLAFYGQVLLQVAIILTGNYNFFNLLTIVLCLTLLDDKHLGYRRVRDLSLGFLSLLKSILSRLGYWLVLGAMTYYTIHYFALTIDTEAWSVRCSTAFTKSQFDSWMQSAVPATVCAGVVSLAVTVAESLSCSLFEPRSLLSKVCAVLATLCYGAVAAAMFGVSLVPYTSLDMRTHQQLSPVLVELYHASTSYHVTGSYGLFRRMTGVGGRPEVQLEGADHLEGPWLEYEFPYKPGSLDRPNPIVAPHQPRLDWQMWFAALSSYGHEPWLLSLSYRLLLGVPEVVRLLDPNSPWRQRPPKYIRATKYLYSFTAFNSSSPNWWARREEGEYFPIFSADHAPLTHYLQQQGLLGGRTPTSCSNPYLCPSLDWLYQSHCNTDAVVVVWGVVVAVMVVVGTRRRMGFV